MKYLSTRGNSPALSFSDILLGGLAPDGGLYLPEAYPQVSKATLARWRELSYAELAYEIFSLYVDDSPAADLKALVAKTYTAQTYHFSRDPAKTATYFAQVVTSFKKFEDVYPPFDVANPGPFVKDLAGLLEDEAGAVARRNRFLDHLLARFAEDFHDYVRFLNAGTDAAAAPSASHSASFPVMPSASTSSDWSRASGPWPGSSNVSLRRPTFSAIHPPTCRSGLGEPPCARIRSSSACWSSAISSRRLVKSCFSSVDSEDSTRWSSSWMAATDPPR